jgi:hypothetical protein
MKRGACLLLSIGTAALASAQTVYTVNIPTTGTYNMSALSWSPSVPPAGGGTDVQLVFGSGIADEVKYTVVNDLLDENGAFTLNSITFTNSIATFNGGRLVFAANGGTLPTAFMMQPSMKNYQTLNADVELAADTTFGGISYVQIYGTVSGTGTLIVDAVNTEVGLWTTMPTPTPVGRTFVLAASIWHGRGISVPAQSGSRTMSRAV